MRGHGRGAPQARRRARRRCRGRARRRRATAGRDRGSQHGGIGLAALVVDLVGDEDDRLAGAAQQLGDGLVVIGGPDGRVDDEHHDVGEVDRDLGLLGHPEVDAGRARSASSGPVSTTVKRRPAHSPS